MSRQPPSSRLPASDPRVKPAGALHLGDPIPDFSAETSKGPIPSFHAWMGEGNYAILFSHPADYTPVCTTELAAMFKHMDDFEKRNTKIIGLSCDSVGSHKAWEKDVCKYAGHEGEVLPFPMIADENRELALRLGIMDPAEKDKGGLPLTARSLFIIGPDKRLKLSILYPATTGRNVEEILRVLDSVQLTDKAPVATPAGWMPGQDVMVHPSVLSKDEAKTFPKGVKTTKMVSGKDYMRYTPQPSV